jgi:hypothetical protein
MYSPHATPQTQSSKQDATSIAQYRESPAMAIKISKKIKGYSVQKPEDRAKAEAAQSAPVIATSPRWPTSSACRKKSSAPMC